MLKKYWAVLVFYALGAFLTLAAVAVAQSTQVQGIAGVGSSATGIRPVIVSGIDGSGAVAAAAIETTTNCLLVSRGINNVIEPPSYVVPTASNGTTLVSLVSGTSGKRVIISKLYAYNSDSVTHTLTIVDSGANQTIFECLVPSTPGNVILDSEGAWQTVGSGNLQFKIDGTGTGSSVKVGVLYVKK